MDEYILDLGMPFNCVKITISRKDIKNVHLKVFRDLQIILSLPENVPDEWIIDFLNKKRDWIKNQLSKYKQASGYNNLLEIKSGSSTQMLGKDRRIIKKYSAKSYVAEDEKNIYVYVKALDDDMLSQRVLRKWWRDKAFEIYNEEMMILYERIFRKYNIDIPSIQIKKMKTLWGSCIPAKGKITLNEYLLKADQRCIQYVILHELTHLLYPYHNNDFYNFLKVQMPDWKVRKEQLDKEVVQGL